MPSSVFAVMVYDPEGQILEIVYRGHRGTYRYFEVPMEEWTAFRASPSKGTYLNEVFKPKEYRYEKTSPATPRMPHGSLRWPEPGRYAQAREEPDSA